MNWLDKFMSHLGNAFSTAYGWFIALLTASITFIQPEMWTFIVVGMAVMADFIWGILAAIKLKKFILSNALRETIKKIAIYSFTLLGVMSIEMIIHENAPFVLVKTIGMFAAVCELWSMSASMLIVRPNTPFLKLFRKQLIGEIQSKVGKNIDIEQILKESDKKKEEEENNGQDQTNIDKI
jgi:hypothetical protein